MTCREHLILNKCLLGSKYYVCGDTCVDCEYEDTVAGDCYAGLAGLVASRCNEMWYNMEGVCPSGLCAAIIQERRNEMSSM